MRSEARGETSYVRGVERRAEAEAAAERAARPERREPVVAGETLTKAQRAVRMLEGRRRAVAEGFKVAGRVPFGYAREGSRADRARAGSGRAAAMTVDPVRGPIVREVFAIYLRVGSIKRTLREVLARWGAVTEASGRRPRWSAPRIGYMLRNVTYVGRIHEGDVRVRGAHEAIVPPVIFNKVGALLDRNNKKAGRRPVTGRGRA